MKKPLKILGVLGIVTACVAVGHKVYKLVSSSNDIKLEDNNNDDDIEDDYLGENGNNLSYKLDPADEEEDEW